jgi:hypothetical protein
MAPHARALPLSMARNNGDIEFHELISPHFRVYFDSRSPGEGNLVVRSLESAYPLLNSWFLHPRSKPLPVIVSAATDGVSFANFITDAIELQTAGQGTRELYWHEYIHSLMYEYFHNFLGPAGSLIHLPWLPAWFIEGLAEALSASIGSDVQGSVERYYALSDTWPSYDKLFSLYGGGDFFVPGYSVAGTFVAWLLRQKEQHILPELLREFYRYTFPDYVLLTMVPFYSFMPFDAALARQFTVKSGRELYEDYKKQARSYWQRAQQGPLFSGEQTEKYLGPSYRNLVRDAEGQPAVMERSEGGFRQRRLHFDADDSWALGLEKEQLSLPPRSVLPFYTYQNGTLVSVHGEVDPLTGTYQQSLRRGSETKEITSIAGQLAGLYSAAGQLLWIEREQEVSRLCVVAEEKSCPLTIRMPSQLHILGTRTRPEKPQEISELWLAVSEQSTSATSYHIKRVILSDNPVILPQSVAKGIDLQIIDYPYRFGGTPLQVMISERQIWLLRGEHNRRGLLELAADGSCRSERIIEDFPLSGLLLGDERILFELYQGTRSAYKKIQPDLLPSRLCHVSSGQRSPLLWAMNQRAAPLPSLPEALHASSLWSNDIPPLAATTAHHQISQVEEAITVDIPPARPYSWRSRHILTFPWIGSNDPLGDQVGVVSVPLMDELQNETLRASLLFGLQSKYPNCELALASSRWWPTLSWGLSRAQRWNGNFAVKNGGASYPFYYDQYASDLSAALPLYFWKSTLTTTLSLRSAKLRPYIGPVKVREGNLEQVGLQLAYVRKEKAWKLGASLLGKTTPAAINGVFSFSNLAAELSARRSLDLFSRVLQGSLRLRGAATYVHHDRGLLLQEFYQPLESFVPGSGASIAQSNIPLSGKGRLFGASFGDRKAQLSGMLSYPLIPAIDRQRWLFYFKHLNLTFFYNYGGAWYHEVEKKPRHLIASTAAQISLHFENKGVNLNSGLGLGKVLGDRELQYYGIIGFDAFF